MSQILLLSSLGLIGFSVYLFVSTILKNTANEDALAWASGDEPSKSKSPIVNFSRNLVHNFTIGYAQKVKSISYRKKVEDKILTAGLTSELNVDEFIGLQILWGIAAPALMFILNFALQLGFSNLFCAIIGLLGWFFPHFYCFSQKKSRNSQVIVELPFYIDILALSTEAGLDFIGAIQRIVDKANDTPLANEFSIVLKDIKLGSSRADALRKMSTRVDMSEVNSFCAVIIDADQTGASISQVLKDQSIQMRLERFVRAEKAGARASQAILMPMMMFILPAVFIMVFAPVVIQFFNGGS